MSDPVEAVAKKFGATFLFRAFIGVCMAYCTTAGTLAFAWLKTNYVSTDADQRAWEKQVGINEKLAQQSEDLRRSDAIQSVTLQQHDAALRDIRQDIRDQRAILRLPKSTLENPTP